MRRNSALQGASLPDPQSPWHPLGPLLDVANYTAAESIADGLIHLVGLAAAGVAIVWLLDGIGPGATGKQIASVSIYGFGLVGMLSASALYNLVRPGRLKAVLWRLDHSMIFVMIAGSYTPFAINALPPQLGIPLCVAVWSLAAIGIGLKLACPHRCQPVSLALYLGMGWLVLVVLRPLSAVLSSDGMLLLLFGGVIYSLGSLVHTRTRMPFHKPIWHAMVVIAAGLHFAAVAELLARSG